jgi:hypothetical protein
MTRIPALILAASAAMAAPAFGEVLTYYSWDPIAHRYIEHTSVYGETPATVTTYVAPAPATVTTYTYTESAPVTYVEPLPATYLGPAYGEPDIVVTAPRATEDELITYDVMDRIATDPRIQGRVGVETYRNNVTLTGRVTSPVQVERAERDAKSVDGVRDVNNLLRARVGG